MQHLLSDQWAAEILHVPTCMSVSPPWNILWFLWWGKDSGLAGGGAGQGRSCLIFYWHFQYACLWSQSMGRNVFLTLKNNVRLPVERANSRHQISNWIVLTLSLYVELIKMSSKKATVFILCSSWRKSCCCSLTLDLLQEICCFVSNRPETSQWITFTRPPHTA